MLVGKGAPEPPPVTPAGGKCQEEGQSEDTDFLPKLHLESDVEYR